MALKAPYNVVKYCIQGDILLPKRFSKLLHPSMESPLYSDNEQLWSDTSEDVAADQNPKPASDQETNDEDTMTESKYDENGIQII